MRARHAVAATLLGVVAVLVWAQATDAAAPDLAPMPYDTTPAPAPPVTDDGAAAAAATIDRQSPAAPPTAPDVAAPAPGLEPALAPLLANATAPVLRVHLRGLHPAAAWTTSLHLVLDAAPYGERVVHDARAAPDAHGTVDFELPPWAATAALDVRIDGDDPNYVAVEHRCRDANPAPDEIVLDVQVVARLTGRVVDVTGAAVVAARVVAFPLRDGAPVDAAIAHTNAAADGSFTLRVPPAVPLWVLAVPMHPTRRARSGGDVADDGRQRVDLLPAAAFALGTIGTTHVLPDFVLQPAPSVAGSVRWSDGTPVVEAAIEVRVDGGAAFRLERGTYVQRHADGRLSPGAQVETDETGAFELPVLPGAPVTVALVHLGVTSLDVQCVGARPVLRVAPPQRADFVLDRPVRVRVHHDGARVANARLELAGERTLQVGNDGTRSLLATGPVRARAQHGRLRSPWRELGPADAGTTVDLELADTLAEITLEFDGEHRVRNTVVTWTDGRGGGGREHLLRDDRGGPFRVFVEPGPIVLTAAAGAGERSGVFLLPVRRELTAGAQPVHLRLPARFGGTFTVHATDGSGMAIGGRCRLRSPDGTEREPVFRTGHGGATTAGERGVLLDGPSHCEDVLPPGDYELVLDLGARGTVRRPFVIRPREITDVHVRRP